MNKIFLLGLPLFYLLSACGPDEGADEVSYLERMNTFIAKKYAKIESLQDATNSIRAPMEVQNMQPRKLELPTASQWNNTVQEPQQIVETQPIASVPVSSVPVASVVPEPQPVAAVPAVPEENVLDTTTNEVLPEINTFENRDIVHPHVVNHFHDIHRFQNANHHVNFNHINDVKHRHFTRIFNHPSTSYSESTTSAVVETSEAIPPSETTLPVVPCN